MYIYKFENLELEMHDAKAKLYCNDRLVFMGDAYKAILQFIKLSNDSPRVIQKFKAQLDSREKPKFQNQQQITQETTQVSKK